MTCTRTTKAMLINNTRIWKVTDIDSGNYVYIPDQKPFEYIRFLMDPHENNYDRMDAAYEKAEHEFGGRYTDYLPNDDILPCIKLIYTNFTIPDEHKTRVFQPFGEWVFDEACNCLKQYDSETGRMNLGDGFIVPSETEWACITQNMFNGGMNFSDALYACAPDISYPSSVLGWIEDMIKNKEAHFPRYTIILYAHDQWRAFNVKTDRIVLGDGLVVPSSDEIAEIEIGLNAGNDLTSTYIYYGLSDILPPESIRQCIEDKIRNTSSTWEDIFKSCKGGNNNNKTLYYFIAGSLVLLLISSR